MCEVTRADAKDLTVARVGSGSGFVGTLTDA
jgi:hypothetical protein